MRLRYWGRVKESGKQAFDTRPVQAMDEVHGVEIKCECCGSTSERFLFPYGKETETYPRCPHCKSGVAKMVKHDGEAHGPAGWLGFAKEKNAHWHAVCGVCGAHGPSQTCPGSALNKFAEFNGGPEWPEEEVE